LKGAIDGGGDWPARAASLGANNSKANRIDRIGLHPMSETREFL
jgi:hypothetical protein